MTVHATMQTAPTTTQPPTERSGIEPDRPAVAPERGALSAPWEGGPARREAAPRVETVLDPGLTAILRCPLTGGGLIPVDADRLMSDRPFRDGVHPVYPVVNGIACLSPSH